VAFAMAGDVTPRWKKERTERIKERTNINNSAD